jgi:hypothetical protein
MKRSKYLLGYAAVSSVEIELISQKIELFSLKSVGRVYINTILSVP